MTNGKLWYNLNLKYSCFYNVQTIKNVYRDKTERAKRILAKRPWESTDDQPDGIWESTFFLIEQLTEY